MKKVLSLLLCLLTIFSLVACGSAEDAIDEDELWQEGMDLEIPEEMIVPLGAAPVSGTLMPSADGKNVYSNQNAAIDASHLDLGYVMIKYTGTNTANKKVIITGPSQVKYTYDLRSDGQYEVFPLSDGNGNYSIGIFQNIQGTKYSSVYSASVNVTLKDEFAPFLLPNQYVNYTADSPVVKKAAELVAGKTTTTDKIDAIYKYVIDNVTYDTNKAKTVQSGYLPNVDEIYRTNTGICFDYAALMTAMLRSQGVPTKLVIGYAGTAYHAWINTWSENSGWIEGVIFFDGTTWKLMDPTFASGSHSSEAIMKYIGDGTNYSAKYLY